MFYMFEVPIPVDAYPVFGLKRRSFLFVMDKNKEVTLRCLFIFSFAQERGDKRLHSSALCIPTDAPDLPTPKKRTSFPFRGTI